MIPDFNSSKIPFDSDKPFSVSSGQSPNPSWEVLLQEDRLVELEHKIPEAGDLLDLANLCVSQAKAHPDGVRVILSTHPEVREHVLVRKSEDCQRLIGENALPQGIQEGQFMAESGEQFLENLNNLRLGAEENPVPSQAIKPEEKPVSLRKKLSKVIKSNVNEILGEGQAERAQKNWKKFWNDFKK